MKRMVVISTVECTGCEACVEICPEVFVMDEMEQKARVIKDTDEPEILIEEAIKACPAECILWEG